MALRRSLQPLTREEFDIQTALTSALFKNCAGWQVDTAAHVARTDINVPSSPVHYSIFTDGIVLYLQAGLVVNPEQYASDDLAVARKSAADQGMPLLTAHIEGNKLVFFGEETLRYLVSKGLNFPGADHYSREREK